MLPDRSSTFGDLLLDLAQELGFARMVPNVAEIAAGADVADNTPRLPDDPATLKRIKDAANDGARDMERANKWSWTRPTLTITLNAGGTGPLNHVPGDASRLRLDHRVFSMPLGEVSWSDLEQTGRSGLVVCTHQDRVVSALARAPEDTGPPRLCAVRPVTGVATPLGDRPGYELIVSPKPDSAYVITARFRVAAAPMLHESERPSWPEIHDRTWLAFAVCAFYGRNVTPAAVAIKDAALAESRRQEQDLAPTTLGRLGQGRAVPARTSPSIRDFDGNVLVP